MGVAAGPLAGGNTYSSTLIESAIAHGATDLGVAHSHHSLGAWSFEASFATDAQWEAFRDAGRRYCLRSTQCDPVTATGVPRAVAAARGGGATSPRRPCPHPPLAAMALLPSRQTSPRDSDSAWRRTTPFRVLPTNRPPPAPLLSPHSTCAEGHPCGDMPSSVSAAPGTVQNGLLREPEPRPSGCGHPSRRSCYYPGRWPTRFSSALGHGAVAPLSVITTRFFDPSI